MEEAVSHGLNFNDTMFICELSFAPFATIINCFAFFIVIKHTPAAMKQYRKYLIGVQFWMAVFDLCVHALIRPLFFFPYVAMGATGFLSRFFHIPAHIQMSCMLMSLCANFAGLLSTLMYRRNQMLPPGSFKFSEVQMRFIHLFGATMQVASCVYYYIAGLDNLGPVNASDPRLAYIETVQYTINPLLQIWFYIIFAVCGWVLVFSLTFVFSIFFQLAQMREILSERTFEMQKNFSMTLLLQLGATFTLFLLPMGFSFVTVFTGMNAPILQLAASYIPSFHSTVYTLILLVHTPVYLDATLCYLRIRKDSRMRRPTLIEPSHSESTVQRPKPVKTQSLTSNIVPSNGL